MLQNKISKCTEYNRYAKHFKEIRNISGPCKKILSFGCSTGEEVFTLKELYYQKSEIHGIDIHKDIINSINNKNTELKFYDSIESLSKYDIIFCMSVLCRWPLINCENDYTFDTFEKTLILID